MIIHLVDILLAFEVSMLSLLFSETLLQHTQSSFEESFVCPRLSKVHERHHPLYHLLNSLMMNLYWNCNSEALAEPSFQYKEDS